MLFRLALFDNITRKSVLNVVMTGQHIKFFKQVNYELLFKEIIEVEIMEPFLRYWSLLL